MRKIMLAFADRYEKIQSIPGWLVPQQLIVQDAFLTLQRKAGLTGNLVEIGVWKGRLASLMALHRTSNEQILLIDPAINNQIVTEAFNTVGAEVKNTHVLPLLSQRLPTVKGWENLAASVRYFHIDGEHSRQAVIRDLELADFTLHDDGLVIVDDFFNNTYPQVSQAVFEYQAANSGRLILLVHGFNKAILCRPKAYANYQTWMMQNLAQILRTQGHDAILAKTSSILDTSCYTIQLNNVPDATGKRQEFPVFLGPDWDNTKIETLTIHNI
jgi:hypothetical protein